jgi:hypothetical protein
VKAREIFYGAQCLSQGQISTVRSRPTDPCNLVLYDLTEVCLLSAYSVIDAFERVLKVNPQPLYKPEFFGEYNEAAERGKMSGPQKFDEDKIMLLEILGDIVLFNQINRNVGFSGADGFSKLVGIFREDCRHTLTLDFAAQVHLDIRQVLRGRSIQAWSDLRTHAHNSKASLIHNLDFHKSLKVETWAIQNDLMLQGIIHKITTWFEQDTFQEQKANIVST